MLKTHLSILAVFILLAIPVYLIDRWLLMPRGGGSFLDLSGLFFWLYVGFAAVHVVVSSLGFFLFRPGSMVALHVLAVLVSILALGLGIYAVESYSSMKTREAHQEKMSAREKLYDTVVLEKWWYAPEEADPQAVYMEVSFKRGGRFSGSMSARGPDEDSLIKFWAEMDRQVSVGPGDRQIFKMPVQRDQPGRADYVIFWLYLFPETPQLTDNHITKRYSPEIDLKDDGKVMYAVLPERSAAP
ncbi:hypothetical protein EOI86_05620 [Hwanghaeella grinnelliae]|uniref:Uncharacterized protein n=1 Tax=Hwanghaeella grinnelliae TaxID=2500179 RepID=A0A437QWA3_9PROT|nr:hypothetical protein [Hwanghaeella grinnelliae]RVU38749.1 hypothetical protein EOI86_05620 [Hwanghaeella grinnelliae]